VLRARVDALGLVSTGELEALRDQAQAAADFCREGRERVQTAVEEVRWLDRTGTSPADYLRQLRAAPEEGLVLIPHDGPAPPESPVPAGGAVRGRPADPGGRSG
jgi:hypothetical protein